MNNQNIEHNSFHIAFQVSKKHIFEVNYYRLGSNKNKEFQTSASILNYGRTDYQQCGQAQESVLNIKTAAYRFYKKWDVLHLQPMTVEQYTEMLTDLNELKQKYDFIEMLSDSDHGISFDKIVELDRKGKFNK